MDTVFPIIFFAAIGMVFVFWNGLRDKKKTKEDESNIYRAFWAEFGVSGKWWIIALNLTGNLVLLRAILTVRSQNGSGLAHWGEIVGFTYFIWIMWPSVLVAICIFFSLRYEVNRENIRRKWPYLVLAIVSISFPFVLAASAKKFIGA